MRRHHFILLILCVIYFFRWYQDCDQRFCLDKESFSSSIEESSVINSSLLLTIREQARMLSLKLLPSPHSELLLGITIGLDELDKTPVFSEALRKTGTIHVVVVSGYNISLVFNFIYVLLGKPYKKFNLIVGILFTLFYALLSGFQPPVIRAWLMGLVTVIGKYYGKGISIVYVLVVTALVMLIISPYLITSLSFQLSFLATLSLVLYSASVMDFFLRTKLKNLPILPDLASSLGAQVLVWPLISYHFATVNLLSPLINGLILWTIPLGTVSGSLLIVSNYINKLIPYVLSLGVFVPLDIFVLFITICSKIPYVSIDYKLPIILLGLYYFIALYISRNLIKNELC